TAPPAVVSATVTLDELLVTTLPLLSSTATVTLNGPPGNKVGGGDAVNASFAAVPTTTVVAAVALLLAGVGSLVAELTVAVLLISGRGLTGAVEMRVVWFAWRKR